MSRDLIHQSSTLANGWEALTIYRRDSRSIKGYAGLNALKTDLYPNQYGMEVHPPEEDLVNVRNMRHIMIAPYGLDFSEVLAWPTQLTTTAEQNDFDAMYEIKNTAMDGAFKRHWALEVFYPFSETRASAGKRILFVAPDNFSPFWPDPRELIYKTESFG